MTFLRRAAVAAGFGALVGPLLVVPTADAGLSLSCLRHARADTADIGYADLVALPARRTTPRYVARQVAPHLGRHVRIPVYVHVISGRHHGEHRHLSRARIRQAVGILNGAFAGRESGASAAAPFRFHLAGIDRTRREGWYHAYLNGPRDARMKRALHRGGAGDLNVYLNAGGGPRRPLLGWSRYPWQYARAHRLDGVNVNLDTLRGGRASGYDRGDTLVHETGHWLGLLHTFDNGCSRAGDLVADTPNSRRPSWTCRGSAQLDFMDYAPDSCMSVFTPGQVRRMESAWVRFRQISRSTTHP